MARRQRVNVVPVRQAKGGQLVGYVRIIELQLNDKETVSATHELLEISESTSHIAAITKLQTQKKELACVTDEQGKVTGMVYTKDLIDPLFRSD